MLKKLFFILILSSVLTITSYAAKIAKDDPPDPELPQLLVEDVVFDNPGTKSLVFINRSDEVVHITGIENSGSGTGISDIQNFDQCRNIAKGGGMCSIPITATSNAVGEKTYTVSFQIGSREGDKLPATASIAKLKLIVNEGKTINLSANRNNQQVDVTFNSGFGWHGGGLQWDGLAPAINKVLKCSDDNKELTLDGIYSPCKITFDTTDLDRGEGKLKFIGNNIASPLNPITVRITKSIVAEDAIIHSADVAVPFIITNVGASEMHIISVTPPTNVQGVEVTDACSGASLAASGGNCEVTFKADKSATGAGDINIQYYNDDEDDTYPARLVIDNTLTAIINDGNPIKMAVGQASKVVNIKFSPNSHFKITNLNVVIDSETKGELTDTSNNCHNAGIDTNTGCEITLNASAVTANVSTKLSVSADNMEPASQPIDVITGMTAENKNITEPGENSLKITNPGQFRVKLKSFAVDAALSGVTVENGTCIDGYVPAEGDCDLALKIASNAQGTGAVMITYEPPAGGEDATLISTVTIAKTVVEINNKADITLTPGLSAIPIAIKNTGKFALNWATDKPPISLMNDANLELTDVSNCTNTVLAPEHSCNVKLAAKATASNSDNSTLNVNATNLAATVSQSIKIASAGLVLAYKDASGVYSISSQDAMNWTSAPAQILASPTPPTYMQLAWGNDKYMAIDSNANFYESNTGMAWTRLSASPINAGITPITLNFVDGKFLITGTKTVGGGKEAYSQKIGDTNASLIAADVVINAFSFDKVDDKLQMLAAGTYKNGAAFSSSKVDNESWEIHSDPTDAPINIIAITHGKVYGVDKFVKLGKDTNTNKAQVLVSSVAKEQWFVYDILPPKSTQIYTPYAIAFKSNDENNGGIFVTVGEVNGVAAIYTSHTAQGPATWTLRSTPISASSVLKAVIWDATLKKFIVLGNEGNNIVELTSSDGITWDKNANLTVAGTFLALTAKEGSTTGLQRKRLHAPRIYKI